MATAGRGAAPAYVVEAAESAPIPEGAEEVACDGTTSALSHAAKLTAPHPPASTPPPMTTARCCGAAALRPLRAASPTSAGCWSTASPPRCGGRAFDLLLALAERPGQLVGKHALMDLVWPGSSSQENNLAAQVSALRKVLGGDVIATVPGRGYRFVAPIEAHAVAAAAVHRPAAGDRDVEASTQIPALRTNLPAELPALLGRADDLDALGALVDRASPGQRRRRLAASARRCSRSTCSPRVAAPIRRACAGSS